MLFSRQGAKPRSRQEELTRPLCAFATWRLCVPQQPAPSRGNAGFKRDSDGPVDDNAAMKLPQLHLRDLFWLVLVISLGLGWWVHVRRLQSDAVRVQRDLILQADYVQQFVSVLTKLGCEIPPDSDPRCSNGGPYTRIFVPDGIQKLTGCVSFTLSGPRDQLQRTLDGEFGRDYGKLRASDPQRAIQ
jgi:hypothetical protein